MNVAARTRCLFQIAAISTRWRLHGFNGPAKMAIDRKAVIERFLPSLRNHSCGFERCQHGSLEPDMEKIAIYAAGYSFRHVARQLPNGNWTSKLGRLEDIEHESLDAICGEEYGKVVIFMQRRRGSALGAHP